MSPDQTANSSSDYTYRIYMQIQAGITKSWIANAVWNNHTILTTVMMDWFFSAAFTC